MYKYKYLRTRLLVSFFSGVSNFLFSTISTFLSWMIFTESIQTRQPTHRKTHRKSALFATRRSKTPLFYPAATCVCASHVLKLCECKITSVQFARPPSKLLCKSKLVNKVNNKNDLISSHYHQLKQVCHRLRCLKWIWEWILRSKA